MKQLFYTTIFLMLGLSHPSNVGQGQVIRMAPPQDTATIPDTPDTGGEDVLRQADSLNIKAAILNRKTSEIQQGSVKILKAKQREAKQDRDPEPQIVVIEKTEMVKDTTCVYLRDSVYSSLPFWKKHAILLKQCNIKQKVKGWFKRKK